MHPMQYNWNPGIQGYILGAAFFGYMFTLIIGGKISETYSPKIILILGTFISSFSTLVTPLAASVSPYFVMLSQCVRGIAQGFMLPAVSVISANWFPSSERSLLSGLALSGYMLALILGGILSSLICEATSIGGWPVVFYSFGGFGILISMLQFFSLTSLPEEDRRISSAELKYILENQENKMTTKRPAVPWGKILCSMPTYALLYAMFSQYWMGCHFLSVHPTFLATVLHYPMAQNGVLVSTPYALSFIVNVSTSFLSSFWHTKNYLSLTKIRNLWNILGSLIYSGCLALMIITKSENIVTITSTVIVIASLGLVTSNLMVVPLHMTPTFAGSLMALGSTVGSFSGFILPIVSGALTNEEQSVQQWNKFFIISIVIAMSSAIFFCFFGSADIQSYDSSGKDSSLKNESQTKTASKLGVLNDSVECTSHM